MTASNQSRTKPGLLFVTLEEKLVTPTQADLDFLIFVQRNKIDPALYITNQKFKTSLHKFIIIFISKTQSITTQ